MAESVQERRATILLIEDDQGTREMFYYLLAAEGYSVRTVATVEEGLAAVSEDRPAAVLLDLHLPVHDGLECLRRLRASSYGVPLPVAILTADYFLDEAVAAELQTLGARIHFKPVWQMDLYRLVESLVESGSRDRPEHRP